MLIKDALGINNKAVEGRERPLSGRNDKNVGTPAASGESKSGDRVELSERSKDLVKAKEALANTADVRLDKVAEIKQRIANNDYTVDAEQVAGRMIMSFLKEVV